MNPQGDGGNAVLFLFLGGSEGVPRVKCSVEGEQVKMPRKRPETRPMAQSTLRTYSSRKNSARSGPGANPNISTKGKQNYGWYFY